MLRETNDKREALEAYLAGREVIGIYVNGGADPWGDGKRRMRDIKEELDKMFADGVRILIGADEAELAGTNRIQTEGGAGEKANEEDEEAEKGKRRVDVGKILALHNAGWTNKQIAEEMRLSAVTIGKYVRKAEERGIIGMDVKLARAQEGDGTGEQG